MKRIFLIVLDSCGIGEEPDAAEFGDVGSNTLRACAASPEFDMRNLISYGLGNLDGVDYLPKAAQPKAALARLQERSRGKDTTIGHWEIAGIVSERPLPTYPNGFPEDVLRPFRDGPRRPLQQALFRHRGHQGLRRRAPEDRRSHRLHLGGLCLPDRGTRVHRARRAAL